MKGWLAVVLHFVCFSPYSLAPPFQTANCESPQISQRDGPDQLGRAGRLCKLTKRNAWDARSLALLLFFFRSDVDLICRVKRKRLWKQRDAFSATCCGLPLTTKTMLTGDLWRSTEAHSSRGWTGILFYFILFKDYDLFARVTSGRRLNLADFDAEYESAGAPCC